MSAELRGVTLDGWQIKQLHTVLTEAEVLTQEDDLTLVVSTETADLTYEYNCRDGRVLRGTLEADDDD